MSSYISPGHRLGCTWPVADWRATLYPDRFTLGMDGTGGKQAAVNRAHKVIVIVAGVILTLCAAGALLTRGVMDHLPYLHSQKPGWNAAPRQYGIVDQRPWQTARTLAALAVFAEELELAREAERLSDHEVDQAFAQSLRQASAEVRQLTGDSLALEHRVEELEQTVKEDQARVITLAARSGVPAAATSDPASPTVPTGNDRVDRAGAPGGCGRSRAGIPC